MTREESILFQFLQGKNTDIYGRTFSDILSHKGDKKWLEYTHNYIQWIFPLRKYSSAAPSIPLTDEILCSAIHDKDIRRNIYDAFLMMVDFYGLKIEEDGRILPNCKQSEMHWLTPFNHNFLRITRIIGCLSIFHFSKEAENFYQAMKSIAEKNKWFCAKSLIYWKDALSWK